jgi:restriction endonuclease S subunit
MKIAYPASSELQMAIVKKLDSVFTEIEAMRNNLAIKNEQTIQLRRSLLHHAFNGFEEVA